MSLSTFIAKEVTAVEGFFTSEEALVVQFLGPLAMQIVAAVEALGKATFAEGLQVLKDAAMAGVAAGAEAAATGGNAVTAAEAAFVATGSTEGLVVVHNAEAGAIKAAVAIAQANAAPVPAPTA